LPSENIEPKGPLAAEVKNQQKEALRKPIAAVQPKTTAV
jgi:hypothetical protein